MHWTLGRPYWEYSATVAVAAAAGHLVLRSSTQPRRARVAAFLRDLAIIAGIFAVYQHTVHYAHTHVAGAEDRATRLWTSNVTLHLPSELSVQHAVLPHPDLVRFLNAYYESVHLPLMVAFVLWLLCTTGPTTPRRATSSRCRRSRAC